MTIKVTDDEWGAIFGCKRHGGRVRADHSTEEKDEDDAILRAEEDARTVERHRMTASEFDSGVVQDLHCDEGPSVWKNYLPGVGPIIRNQTELRDYCRLTGHRIVGQSHVENHHPINDGVASRFKKRVRVDDGFTEVGGRFRRSEAEIREQRAIYERGQRAEAKARAEQEKKRHEPKKFYFMP